MENAVVLDHRSQRIRFVRLVEDTGLRMMVVQGEDGIWKRSASGVGSEGGNCEDGGSCDGGVDGESEHCSEKMRSRVLRKEEDDESWKEKLLHKFLLEMTFSFPSFIKRKLSNKGNIGSKK